MSDRFIKVNAWDLKVGDKLHGECEIDPNCVSTVIKVTPAGEKEHTVSVEFECLHCSSKAFVPSQTGRELFTVIKGASWQKDPPSSEKSQLSYPSGGLLENETTSFGEQPVAADEQRSDPDLEDIRQTLEETSPPQTQTPSPCSESSPSSLNEDTTESS